MAPRNRRSKVGLGRMDAALDAMRPMGFPSNAVRKSVKKLLKVYGDDGWPFIEEAAYKLLIDTILEEPEEDETGTLRLEGASKESQEQPASVSGHCDKEATYECEDRSFALEHHGRVQTEGQDSVLEDVKGQKVTGTESCSTPAYNAKALDITCRPCYGWISDDEEEHEIVELTSSSSSLAADLAA